MAKVFNVDILENIYIFKVKDYTTILIGQYSPEEKCFFIQRGDGTKYSYDEYRIEWSHKLKVEL